MYYILNLLGRIMSNNTTVGLFKLIVRRFDVENIFYIR